MTIFFRAFRWPHALAFLFAVIGSFSCASNEPSPPPSAPPAASIPPKPIPPPSTVYPVMLGIDVLEAENFAPIAGKRIGLLTHPAGVNRKGVSTIDVLRRAPNVKLVALFGVEHGIYNELPAEKTYSDHIDPRTGLMVFSLYTGIKEREHKPTKAQLKGLDALVIDLQDNGSRSYTFISAMKVAMEACFENGVEVVVLDRPNPLGGLKVDGPPLDPPLASYVGEFHVPYVYGLTIGELALMAKEAPGVLGVPETVRERGQLVVVPMRGWRRSMRWPETGLNFVPTSPLMPDFASCVGYAMVGLGTYIGGFSHGVGSSYPFRGLTHKAVKPEMLEHELDALHLPGLQFRIVSALGKNGKPASGVYVEVANWEAWQPTELSFYMMRLACQLEPRNPFATASPTQIQGFLLHMGSTAFFEALRHDGAKVNVEAFLADWAAHNKIYQEQSKRYWLYAP